MKIEIDNNLIEMLKDEIKEETEEKLGVVYQSINGLIFRGRPITRSFNHKKTLERLLVEALIKSVLY